MDSNGMKIVKFELYCRKCAYFYKKESEDPCNKCLSEGGRLYSHKPSEFVEKGKD